MKIVLHVIDGKVYEGVESIPGSECSNGCVFFVDQRCTLSVNNIFSGCFLPEMEGRNYRKTNLLGPKPREQK